MNAPRSLSVSSMDGMAEIRTLSDICKDSDDANRPSNCCARREASKPLQVYASTYPWRVSQGVNTPPVQAGSREAFISLTFLIKLNRGRGALKWPSPQNHGDRMSGHASGPDLGWLDLPSSIYLRQPPPGREEGTHPPPPRMQIRGEGRKVSRPFLLGRTVKGREMTHWLQLLSHLAGPLQRNGDRNQK